MVVKITCGKGTENLSADDKLVIDKIIKEYEDKISRHGEKIDVFEENNLNNNIHNISVIKPSLCVSSVKVGGCYFSAC